ncbi:uncharacterized protein B0P05DRAFT_585230 [Gilbertella persicaria]|uniref:uncharacterized protein n=1 Tax=Gilbertella persicaria TaxID=101096 RepID=UPI00221F1E6E|nr:uncharacterized protein B0P05DRAFT_585230 [Gilbertella persicaria]KAI8087012.1 hypothetical protein B0P05DRAFT_585230 [Gilbertella persicaria]
MYHKWIALYAITQLVGVNSFPIDTKPSTSLEARTVTFTSSIILAVSSPAFFPKFAHHGSKPLNPVPTGPIKIISTLKKENYPQAWTAPDVNHPEVQAAIKAIDWTYVPNLDPQVEGGPNYDNSKDVACWWTNTQCTKPKVNYLPEDVRACASVGDFGLTYDDGPLPPQSVNDPWAEPRLYNFLAGIKQRATLFYVGSNVVAYPDAAVRALQSGHTLCAHTWSHPHMTTLHNHDIVAQLYWSMRAIKEAAGVTTRCWRAPYGDVDDRVRAIAHQMGLYTIVWNSDSFDWGLPSAANGFSGTLTQETIDGYFQNWIAMRENKTDTEGRIVLEHENSNMTILTSEKWLVNLREAFHVKTVHECEPSLPGPYWES